MIWRQFPRKRENIGRTGHKKEAPVNTTGTSPKIQTLIKLQCITYSNVVSHPLMRVGIRHIKFLELHPIPLELIANVET